MPGKIRLAHTLRLLLVGWVLLAGCAAGGSAARPTPAPAPPAPSVSVPATTRLPAPSPTPAEPATLRVPILMYHHIAAYPAHSTGLAKKYWVSPDDFAAQLAAMQQYGYHTITPDELLGALQSGTKLPSRPILLTFDDGYADFYTQAYPLLKQYGAKATIYVISAKLGLSTDMGTFLSWEQLRELAAAPLITVGAHARTHASLTKISNAQLDEELVGSKHDLEEKLGLVVRHFAYPGGRYNQKVLRQTRTAGFVTAVTTRTGNQQRRDQPLELRRILVEHDAPLGEIIREAQTAPKQ